MSEDIIVAVCNMFMPLTILGLGLMVWKTHPPFGDMFGYRTTQSQKSPEAWVMAQALFGKSCTLTYAILSFLTLIAGLVTIFFKVGETAETWIITAVNIVDFAALFVVIFITDSKVKKYTAGNDEPK